MERIMIVDDTKVLTNLYCNFLTKLGYSSSPAYSGTECIEKLESESPDIILLDIMMEPIDGWKTLEFIKSNSNTRGIPVVMMTAKAPVPSDIMDYGNLIDGYVMKPVKPAELKGIIEMVHERRKKAAESLLTAKKAGACEEKQRLLFDLFIQQDVLERLRELIFETYSLNGGESSIGEMLDKELHNIRIHLEKRQQELTSLKNEMGII